MSSHSSEDDERGSNDYYDSEDEPAGVDPSVFSVLEGRNLKSVAGYIKSGKCKRIVVLAGAGISTSAGIPDFRSPETGLYANLEKFNLPYPEAVFDINFFRKNPKPFYALAKELQPGSFLPTPTHHFISLLHRKSLLHLCLTQNIDCLERLAGLPEAKVVEAHGSFASNSCIENGCGKKFDGEKMKKCVDDGKVPKCDKCGGLVKPDIVFFGEGLPKRFFGSMPTVQSADLMIIMGTSLTVHPFASLPSLAPPSIPRVLINLEKVGGIGSRVNDVVLLGECDAVIKELCKELGWDEELAKACGSDVKEKGKGRDVVVPTKSKEERDAEAQAKIEAIAKEIEEKLKLDSDYKDSVVKDLTADKKDGAYEDEYGLEYDPIGARDQGKGMEEKEKDEAVISTKGEGSVDVGSTLAKDSNKP